MSAQTITLSRGVAAITVVGLLALGATGAWLWRRAERGPSSSPAATVPTLPVAAATKEAPPSSTSSMEVVVLLTPEAIARAGIIVAPVGRANDGSSIHAPGTVAPNAYRHIVVTPLVAGRVTRVVAELGQRVRQGQPMATVYSPELAEALARLRLAQAMLAAHDRELQRTEKLVAIGAASRQELERVHAEHTSQSAEAESARARVELLGGTTGQRDASSSSEVVVPAPLSGTVIERTINVGLNVEAGAPIFAVADLSTVWVVADLFEADAARVRVGAEAIVTIPTEPDVRLVSRVAYVNPQTAASTRTTKVRIELPNPGERLRIGAYVTVDVSPSPLPGRPSTDRTVSVPRRAIQMVGERAVVYVASPDRHRFVERVVVPGDSSGDTTQITSGLTISDAVVVDGSFYLRAEAERLGLRSQTGASGSAADITVTEKGFEPSTLTLKSGVPARVRFRRVTDNTCAKEIVIPQLKIRRALPLNETVAITLTPTAGELAFACGMNMLTGTIVVR